MYKKNEEHKYEHIWWKYREEGHFLVDPILDSFKTVAEQHESNSFKYYEYTQTIDPKKFDRIPDGLYKTGRTKYRKQYLGDQSPEKQHSVINRTIDKYITERGSPFGDIVIIQAYEFNKNGNIHSHGIIRHSGDYEVYLRKFQQHMKSKIGRNSISPIRKIESWIGYMLKEIETTQIPITIINKELIKNKYSTHDIRHYMKGFGRKERCNQSVSGDLSLGGPSQPETSRQPDKNKNI